MKKIPMNSNMNLCGVTAGGEVGLKTKCDLDFVSDRSRDNVGMMLRRDSGAKFTRGGTPGAGGLV